jgi:hypothetical protein
MTQKDLIRIAVQEIEKNKRIIHICSSAKKGGFYTITVKRVTYDITGRLIPNNFSIVARVTAFNKLSLRVDVLASTGNIHAKYPSKTVPDFFKSTVDYESVVDLEKFNPDDAPLRVNDIYVSPVFKNLFFNK